ncbi:integrase core domain-containing protein, partial [Acidovorax sp. SUPP3334]
RTQALASWQHHYNWHRPHSGIGSIAPMDRLIPANNLLTVHN